MAERSSNMAGILPLCSESKNTLSGSLMIIKSISPGCIGYLDHPFEKEAPWAFTARLFFVVR
jgi:hypothetical protein